jgi:hypothetical protein
MGGNALAAIESKLIYEKLGIGYDGVTIHVVGTNQLPSLVLLTLCCSYLLPTIMSQIANSQPTSSAQSAKSESEHAALHQYQDDEGHFSLVRYIYFLDLI